ncbi:MAG: hypothetical protein OSB34_11335, partial [Planktomarina sp.]|nr:hypothetical protein [Planktomarina sp.]
IAWSNMVPRTLEAAEELALMGISAEVLDPRTLVPLDRDAILNSVAKTNRCVIIQEAVRRGGVASDISSIIQEEAFYSLDAPVQIVAGMNTPIPFNLKLEEISVPQKDDIINAVQGILHEKPMELSVEK